MQPFEKSAVTKRNAALVVLSAVVALVGVWLLSRPITDCKDFHLAVELSGSDRRLTSWLNGRCSITWDQARSSLLWDFVFILGYAVGLAAVIWRWHQLFAKSRLAAVMKMGWILPLVAGGFDVVENALILSHLSVNGGTPRYPTRMFWPTAIATVSWLKWLLIAISLVLAVMSAMAAFARLADRTNFDWLSKWRARAVMWLVTRREQTTDKLITDFRSRRAAKGKGEAMPVTADVVTDAPQAVPEDLTAPTLGVCCSGGGIRAAAFAIGALDELEINGVMRRAKWLTAVSGGSYAATGWRLAKIGHGDSDVAGKVIDWLEAPPIGGTMGRHRFLRNGPGGFGRALLSAILYVLFNISVLASVVFIFAWPIGRLVSSNAVAPALRLDVVGGHLPRTLTITAEQWWPGLGIIAIAVVVMVISAMPWWKVASLWKVASVIAAVGVVLEVVLVGIPYAMVRVGSWLAGGKTGVARPAAAVGGLTFTSVLLLCWNLVRAPLESKLKANAPKLGGLLLVFLALIWGGKVATDAATSTGLFRSVHLWVALSVAFFIVYFAVGTTELSIHRVYRKRLRRTFGLAWAGDELNSPREHHQVTWKQLAADTTPAPELVICCTQQHTGIAPGGLPAESFTISPTSVTIGDFSTDTAGYMDRMPHASRRETYVSSWMATSGAAFASAMGRLSVGSTNALMAAMNIDLGIWLPNPRLTHLDAHRFPKVRLSYLAKEILGWFDNTDRYVFVADGGHWENLGLVELLRRRCDEIVCIDTSGDTLGAFTTLHQAVDLASLELPDIVEHIDLTNLAQIRSEIPGLPPSSVATFTVTYTPTNGAAEGTIGKIHYAKAQTSSDLSIGARRYAAKDRQFPNYSTGNQFLKDEQFQQLVKLGQEAGVRLATLVKGDGQGERS